MQVGDYVRTKSYGIQKISGFSSTLEEDFIDCDYDKYQRVLINKKEVVKSSPNIIDLIEVGDYVNGLRVEENKYGELYTSYVYYGGDIGKQCEVYTTWLEEYKENEDYIDSILTKEQFEADEKSIELNDKVEIIEEDKNIEKLESYISCGWNGTCKDLKRDDLFNDLKKIGNKINEIIDCINKEK